MPKIVLTIIPNRQIFSNNMPSPTFHPKTQHNPLPEQPLLAHPRLHHPIHCRHRWHNPLAETLIAFNPPDKVTFTKSKKFQVSSLKRSKASAYPTGGSAFSPILLVLSLSLNLVFTAFNIHIGHNPTVTGLLVTEPLLSSIRQPRNLQIWQLNPAIKLLLYR